MKKPNAKKRGKVKRRTVWLDDEEWARLCILVTEHRADIRKRLGDRAAIAITASTVLGHMLREHADV